MGKTPSEMMNSGANISQAERKRNRLNYPKEEKQRITYRRDRDGSLWTGSLSGNKDHF